jgi:hypothetical protein
VRIEEANAEGAHSKPKADQGPAAGLLHHLEFRQTREETDVMGKIGEDPLDNLRGRRNANLSGILGAQ